MIDHEELEARRQARAEHRRRLVRRRRAVALLAMLLLAAALAFAVLRPFGGSAPSAARRGPPAATDHDARAAMPRRKRPRAAVPILMYHVIAPAPPGAPFPELYVPRHEFATQMRALQRAGWVAVTLDELWDAWRHGGTLPRGRPIVVSFDNGYESQANAAMPVLRRLHWVGDLSIQLTGLPVSQGGLSREAIRRLLAQGWELDTQGFSHADLPVLGAADLHREVATARRVLQRRWDVPVHWFCYPSGHYDARVVAAVRAAGYRGSTTVVPGWARRSSDPFRLPRLRVVAGTPPDALERQIAGARHAPAPPRTYG